MNTSELRQVGEIPQISNRPTIRSPRNPMDKSTIVSIFPKAIHEYKHTIEPGVFDIPSGTFEKPSVTVIGPSAWWRDVDIEQPILEIPVGSIMVANSVINDYCNGLLGCNMGNAMPGLFFVPGEWTVAEIKEKHKGDLLRAKARQDNWFKILVRLADSLWARSNNNPLVIADEMRLAAAELGFKDKPWIKDFQHVELVNCKACGYLKNPKFPVCPECHAVDESHPEAKNIKFAAG